MYGEKNNTALKKKKKKKNGPKEEKKKSFKGNFKINLTHAHEYEFILGLVNESNSAPM